MTKLYDFKMALERVKGKREQIQHTLNDLEEKSEILEENLSYAEEAQTIIQTVAKETQSELEYHISDLGSLALASVFDDPYKLVAKFDIKRGKTECDLSFERKGLLVDPMRSTGGGAIDVASFGLRPSLWSLARPRPAPVMIIDEPFRNLSKNLHRKASEMLKMVAERLKLQIIMVTHSDELINKADRVFKLKMNNGISYIKEIF